MKENEIVDYFFDTNSKIISEKYLVLIIYDIVNNSKRVKFSKFLEKYGMRVQKSCFEGIITNAMLDNIKRQIPLYIDKQSDTVRVYKINGSGQVSCFGTASLTQPSEIFII